MRPLRNIAILTFSAFLMAGFGGPHLTMGTGIFMPVLHHVDDSMDTSCPLSPIDHIAWWQHAFAALEPLSGIFAFVFSVGAFFAATFIHTFISERLLAMIGIRRRQRFRERAFTVNTFLFSSGILHPKIYPFAP